MNRLLGKYEGDEKGPLVIVIGGLHGNEKGGVVAIQQMFKQLDLHDHHNVKGKIVGFAGNLRALNLESRFINYDLNRCWQEDFVADLREKPADEIERGEDQEILELLEVIELETKGEYTKRILVDLHTTSAENGNFIVIPQDESDNEVVKVLKLPIIIDLDQYLAGTLLKFMHDRDFVAFAFEGGKIGSAEAVHLHLSGLWELLRAAGSISTNFADAMSRYEDVTADLKDLPHMLSVLYHHRVGDGDAFEMKPGYKNFQKIEKGEIVARDKEGAIKAKYDGLMFMPLYQKFGDDGFFIVKELMEN